MTESVYVLEPGAYIRRDGAGLKVMAGGEVIDRIPAHGLKRLMLVGYVSLSGAMLDFLIRNRVETVFITPTGRFRARLGLDEHRHVVRRRAQYLRLDDPAVCLEAARCIVKGKAENMARLLKKRARQQNAPELAAKAARIRALSSETETAADLARIRGLEGASTRQYYNAFSLLIKNRAFPWRGRSRRPPLDPINALLSFVYTLLTNEVLSAVSAVGLDPYLGALHEVAYGRPSLACDLVEEYRCLLGDRMVLGLVNRKAVSPEDFVFRHESPAEFTDEKEMKERRPVEMKPAVRRTFIAAYESMMNRPVALPGKKEKMGYRRLILEQARAFAAWMENPDEIYRPFTVEV